MESKQFSMDLGGRKLTLEFGKYCEQANGSVWVHLGDTVVMVNATMAPTPREGVDFFPLAVDVEEKQYSVGKIPGGFIKREGRPTDKATLTCRLIDRPLRPLFNKGMRNDVQVVVTILSVEQDVPPEIPAMIGSSIAIAVSDIPWSGPTGAVHVGRINGEYILNPDEEQRKVSDMSLYVAGTKEAIMMVEAGANELSEDVMLDGIMFAHEAIKKLVEFQDMIVAEIGKEKAVVPLITTGDDVKAAVREYAYDKARWTFDTFERYERQQREAQVKAETLSALGEQFPGREDEIAGMRFCRGMLCGTPVVVVQCGIGKVNAGICVQILIDRYSADRVINTGVAGSLNADINICDVVVSSEALQHDMDVSPLGYDQGMIPGLGKVFAADPAMSRLACECAKKAAPDIRVHMGLILSGDQFIAGRQAKDALASAFGGLCAEMEGAAIAQACTLNHVPFVVIRAISDKADDSGHMDYRAFVDQAAVRSAKIVMEMLRAR